MTSCCSTRSPFRPSCTSARPPSSFPAPYPTACAAWRVTTSPGCARAKAKDTCTVSGPWPFAINAYAGREDNNLIFWLPSISAIVTGDSLSDFGEGLDIQLGGRKHVTRDDVVRRLRPLLDLPVELVLPAHGEPTDRAALERVLPERRTARLVRTRSERSRSPQETSQRPQRRASGLSKCPSTAATVALGRDT